MKLAKQALLVTIGLVGSGYVSNLYGHKSGMSHGRIQGCQEVVDAAIPPEFSPTCFLHQGELALSLTHPVTGEERKELLRTGERIQ